MQRKNKNVEAFRIEALETVLNHPQQIAEDRDGKKAYQSHIEFENGKVYLVRAIVSDNTNPAIVITVYRTRQITRYWSNL